MKKSSSDVGGVVYVDLLGMTGDARAVMAGGSDLHHDTDIVFNDPAYDPQKLVAEGAEVSIKADTAAGHKNFTVKYYEGDYNFKTVYPVDIPSTMKFAKNGTFKSVYGTEGSVLVYNYNVPALSNFTIEISPGAQEDFTY